jgi:hypothetical protein
MTFLSLIMGKFTAGIIAFQKFPLLRVRGDHVSFYA